MHLNLMRYFMAEGVSIGHKVAWLAPREPPGGPGQFLPAEARATPSSSSAREDDGEDGSSQGELRIAWQYRKYIQQQPSVGVGRDSLSSSSSSPKKAAPGGSARGDAVEAGIGRQWCKTYDLTKAMGPELPDKNGMVGMSLVGGL